MNEKQVYHFMENYERLSNTYNFDKIAPLINERAIFFFSDRTLEGKEQIKIGFEETWQNLGNDTYKIKNIQILYLSENGASIIYDFHWKGHKNGKIIQGEGRGTSILKNFQGDFQVIHEHLSSKK